MSGDFEQRLTNALRAEAAGLPFGVTEHMVAQRLDRATGGPWLAVLAGAGGLLLIAVIVFALGRGPFSAGVKSQSPSPLPSGCPVTLPNGQSPPKGEMPGSLFYGNSQLITVLRPAGVIIAEPMDMQGDGSAGIKWGWWRGTGIKAAILASGHRLDQTAPPLRIDIPAGYGLSGFQVAGLYFPTPGCWEVTARAGGASLTFVTRVNFPAPTVSLPTGTFQGDVPLHQLCLAFVVSDTAQTAIPAQWWDAGASGDCSTTTSSIVSGTARLVGQNVMAIDIPLMPPGGVDTLRFELGHITSTEIVTEGTWPNSGARVEVRFRRVQKVTPTFAPVSYRPRLSD